MHYLQLQQRPAFQSLAVVGLCAIGLTACASSEKENVSAWQQEKPQINASIQAVQHEQQTSAYALQQQHTAIEALQQKIEALEKNNQQQLTSIKTLSEHVKELHRVTKVKIKKKEKPPAKVEIKHPAPIVKLPPAPTPTPMVPKVNQAALDEAEKNAYTAAYLSLKSGRFEEASKAFNQQLDLYPKGQYADQAWYWLGETRLAQGDHGKALHAFKYVADHYNNSVKHGTSLFKLGQISQSKNHHAEARAYYQRLIQKHADSNLAEQARAALAKLPASPGNQQ